MGLGKEILKNLNSYLVNNFLQNYKGPTFKQILFCRFFRIQLNLQNHKNSLNVIKKEYSYKQFLQIYPNVETCHSTIMSFNILWEIYDFKMKIWPFNVGRKMEPNLSNFLFNSFLRNKIMDLDFGINEFSNFDIP